MSGATGSVDDGFGEWKATSPGSSSIINHHRYLDELCTFVSLGMDVDVCVGTVRNRNLTNLISERSA
jgi:hypothetical protein